MKYFWLTNSLDIKVIGKYPQSEECLNYGDVYSIDYKNILKTLLHIPEPILDSKTNLTSYLSSVPINRLFFIILKLDFINFLKDYNIGDYKVWDITIHHKGKVIKDYNLFYLIDDHQKKYVDYKNCDFYIGTLKDYKWVGDTIKITDHQNFLSTVEILKNQKLMLKCRKHVFNFKSATEDLIRIDDTRMVGTKGYFVSERLKNDILKKGFTGMDFKAIEDIDNRNRIEVIY